MGDTRTPGDGARAPDAAATDAASQPGKDAASDSAMRRDAADAADAAMTAAHDAKGINDAIADTIAIVVHDAGDPPVEAAGDAAPEVKTDAAMNDGPRPVAPGAGDLVIDELLINPAGTDTNREWIEVSNTTALALDLHQLRVADAANEVALDAGVLAAGGMLVLGQSLDPTKNGGAPVDLSFGNTVSLNNPGDSITLCLGPCADGVILDQVTWTSDLGAAYDGHAAIVDPGTGAFCPADQPFGTAASFGSPGQPNPPCGM